MIGEKEIKSISIYDTLQPKQVDFLNAPQIYTFMWWAKWWWKSHAFRAKSLRETYAWPWMRWLVLRRTFPEIEKNFLLPLRSEIPLELYEYNQSKHVMTFNNGSTIELWFCQSANDVYRYQWVEYDRIGIEELTQRPEEWVKIILTSLRTNKDRYQPNFFSTWNPWWVWHAWVKRIFIDGDFKENENPSNYAFIWANIYDNKILMANDPSYLEKLKSLDDKWRKAYLDGNWDIFAWQYFSMFDRHIHVIDPIMPKDAKKYCVALDYWYTNPSAVVWIAQTTQNEFIVYKELYKTGLTYRNLWVHIKAMTWVDEKINVYVGDPAAVNKKTESDETSLALEFAKLWISIDPAKNARVPWWMLIRELLTPHVDPNTKQERPRLFITENCVNLIRTLPVLIHDKTNVEDIDTTWDDHLADALRYWLAQLVEINTSFNDVKEMNNAFVRKDSMASKLSSDVKNDLNFLDVRF